MTGKIGVVLAVGIPAARGRNEPEKRIRVRLAPFRDATDGREVPHLEAIYHLDDLTAIVQG
jgi:hypothetical protein